MMEKIIDFLKEFADATKAGAASYTMTYEDGSTVTIIYKPKTKN